MDCKSAKKLIPAFVDGELRGARASEMEEHIALCAECAREAAELEKTMEVLGGWTAIEPRHTYADFRAHVREVGADRENRRPIGWKLVPRWAVACMLFAGILGGTISGANRGQRAAAEHSEYHVDQASEYLGLDAFGGGFHDAVYESSVSGDSGMGVER